MAGNPRENVKDKGFWDGGGRAHGRDSEAAGRPSGFPGLRKRERTGVQTDMEFPRAEENESKITR